MAKTTEDVKQIELSDNALALGLFGRGGENIRSFEKLLDVTIDTRGSVVNIAGSSSGVAMAERLITDFYALMEKGYNFSREDLTYALRMLEESEDVSLRDVFMDTVYVSYKKKVISPKSLAQKAYIDAMRGFDMVFSIGPAGTGKTYLAIAAAAAALSEKKVERIVLTRPAVEAGERLGFLPGDLAAKIDPYLRPLYDALHDMIDFEQVQTLLERGIIEVAPLAFMRGRTLNNSFVILDEAQNTSLEQMKMFLTRLGFGSKAIITGDVTQVDLPEGKPSGLIESEKILKGVKGIDFIHFTDKDVVRHPLVGKIIRAFEKAGAKKQRVVTKKKEKK